MDREIIDLEDPNRQTVPSPTSRSSPQRVCQVVGTFDHYKRSLVEETGFGGILKLPVLGMLNLKFSSWIMSRVDVRSRCIAIDAKQKIRFWAEDVHKVFQIPCGRRDIRGPDSQPTESTIEIIRTVMGMPEKGTLLLKDAENVITRDISEELSSNMEKDSFKMAFVIFVMGHFLTPSTKHDHTSVDFWGAIACTENIKDFNWCQYVLDDLLAATDKVKADIHASRQVTHLHVCHLFFQVFYLDNLDLGMFNKSHNTLPRIACFDDTSFRRMILQCCSLKKGVHDYSCAPIRDPQTICYMRSAWDTVPDAQTPRTPAGRPPVSPSPAPLNCKFPSPLTVADSVTRIFGATEFSTYLSSTYPKLARSELGIILKQHNAMGLRMATTPRNSIGQENVRLLDKMVASLGESCICCTIRGT